MDKAKEEDKKEAKLVEIPTQMGLAFELEDGSKVSEMEILLKIYNDVQKIKSLL